jgi:competence protein ComEC
MPLLLPLAAVSLALGLGFGCRLDPGLRVPLLMLVLGGVVLVVGRRRPSLALAATAVAWLGAGAALGHLAIHRPLTACHVARAGVGGSVALTAEVAALPRRTHRGWRVPLRALAVAGHGAVCGGVDLYLPRGGPLVWPGERVRAWVRPRPAVPGRNPGVPGGQLRLLRDGVGWRVSADASRLVVLGGARSPPLLWRLRERVRGQLRRAIGRPAPRAIVQALVLGDRRGMDHGLRQRFARAGISHLLAISGLHLSLVALAALLGLRRALLWLPWLAARTDVRRVAAVLAAATALAFTVFTGGAPSAVRACVMVGACFLGLAWQRPPDLARPLSLACICLLVADPLNLLRPGFQLSFAAVIGIALVLRRVPGGRGRTRLGRAWARVRGLALTTLGATLVTAPVVAHHFGQVSLAGLAVNLLAVPWTSLVLLPCSLLGAVAGLVWPAAGQWLLGIAGWAAGVLDRLAGVASAPEVPLVVHASPGWLATLGLCAAFLALLTRRRARRALLALALALVVAGLISERPPGSAEASLEAVFLDVGQGDSTFVRLPDGATLLVDGGGSEDGRGFDPGRTRVLPFLRRAGVRRLDLVVASHPHADHVAGLLSVLDAVPVGELWTCWHDEPSHWMDLLRGRARARGVRLGRPRPWRRGAALVRPLWPAGWEGMCGDPGYGANNNSIVLRLELGRAAMILPGDIERPVEGRLLSTRPELLRADVLKVPHHGSASSSSAAFLRAVAPRLGVISCGLGNGFGIPHPAVLGRYRRLGVALSRVDRVGAVGVCLGADGSLSWRALTGPRLRTVEAWIPARSQQMQLRLDFQRR